MRDDKQDVSVWLRLADGFGPRLDWPVVLFLTPTLTASASDARIAAPPPAPAEPVE